MDIYSGKVKQALSFAETAHKDKTYGGKPYFTAHTEPVVRRVYCLGGEELHMIVACLHDGLEDSVMTVEQIESLFGRTVLVHVLAITHLDGETYADYVRRAARDPVAKLVKLADICCNLESSISGSKESNVLKYRDALKILNETN